MSLFRLRIIHSSVNARASTSILIIVRLLLTILQIRCSGWWKRPGTERSHAARYADFGKHYAGHAALICG